MDGSQSGPAPRSGGGFVRFNEVIVKRTPKVSGFPPCVFRLNVKLIAEELRSHVKSMATRERTAN